MIDLSNMIIRPALNQDLPDILDCVFEAFKAIEYSDHSEKKLVRNIWESEYYIPDLSLVAVCNQSVLGYILFTEIQWNNTNITGSWLAMAPVAVFPGFQGLGIGGKLILEGHHRAKLKDYEGIILIGHDTYYPRFGYEKASDYGIECPIEVPDENLMVYFLNQTKKYKVNSKYSYAPVFDNV